MKHTALRTQFFVPFGLLLASQALLLAVTGAVPGRVPAPAGSPWKGVRAAPYRDSPWTGPTPHTRPDDPWTLAASA